MGISSERPVSAEQVFSALVALRAEPVMDPEVRPAGPQPEDRLRLLGALLATVESEVTAAVPIEEEFFEGLAEVITGWSEKIGPDAALAALVLSHRLQRTALQLGTEDEQEEPSVGRAASLAAVVAGAELLSAQLAAERGDPDGVRRSLNGVEGSLAEVLAGMQQMRVDTGDVEE
jgi:hypothetical protein